MSRKAADWARVPSGLPTLIARDLGGVGGDSPSPRSGNRPSPSPRSASSLAFVSCSCAVARRLLSTLKLRARLVGALGFTFSFVTSLIDGVGVVRRLALYRDGG